MYLNFIISDLRHDDSSSALKLCMSKLVLAVSILSHLEDKFIVIALLDPGRQGGIGFLQKASGIHIGSSNLLEGQMDVVLTMAAVGCSNHLSSNYLIKHHSQIN